MKRILHSIRFLLLLVTLSQIMLSCSETEEFEQQSVDVTFTAAVRNGVQTRAGDGEYAYGSGKYATTLLVAVFNNDEMPQIIGEPQEFHIDPLSSSGNNVTINLTKNQTYNIIFWAYNKEAEVYDLTQLPKVTMIAPGEAMTFEQADAMDAFYAVVRYTATAGNTPETVPLKRPLAQINVGTSGTAVPATFKVEGTYNTFYPFDGTFSGEATFSWAFNETTTNTFRIKDNPEQYTYLVLGYLFAPLGEDTEAVKKTCQLELTETDREIPPFQDVELHANRRSNIVGSFTE